MTFRSSLRKSIPISLAVAGLVAMAGAAEAGQPASAFGLAANFNVGGLVTGINPVNPLTGGKTPSYGKSNLVGPYQKTLHIARGKLPVPTVSVTAESLTSSVSGGFGIDTSYAVGKTTAKALDIVVDQYPPPPIVLAKGETAPASIIPIPFPRPFLRISARLAQSSANANFGLPMPPNLVGSANFSGLVIDGTAVGPKPIKLSGMPSANLAIVQTPTVTVTLNEQTISGPIVCKEVCIQSLAGVSTRAIHITFNNAMIAGRAVSGEIIVGDAQAGQTVIPLGVATQE